MDAALRLNPAVGMTVTLANKVTGTAWWGARVIKDGEGTFAVDNTTLAGVNLPLVLTAGSLAFTGNVNVALPVTVAGSVALNTGAGVGTLSGTLSGGGMLNLTGVLDGGVSIAQGASVTVNGGTLTAFEKRGVGELTLGSSAVLTGASAQVKAGTLKVTSSETLARVAELQVGTSADSGARLDVSQITGGLVVGGSVGGLAAPQVLKGSGTLKGLVRLAAGATIAPGNSPGTQTIDGNLQVFSGATCQFEYTLSGMAVSDLLWVVASWDLPGSGSVELLGGIVEPKVYSNTGGAGNILTRFGVKQRILILNTQNGVTGKFDGVRHGAALRGTLVYTDSIGRTVEPVAPRAVGAGGLGAMDPLQVYLELERVPYASLGNTQAQREAGRGLDLLVSAAAQDRAVEEIVMILDRMQAPELIQLLAHPSMPAFVRYMDQGLYGNAMSLFRINTANGGTLTLLDPGILNSTVYCLEGSASVLAIGTNPLNWRTPGGLGFPLGKGTPYTLILRSADGKETVVQSGVSQKEGSLEVPLKNVRTSGVYAIAVTVGSESEGGPASHVSNDVRLSVIPPDSIAGTYDVLLTDATGVIPDSASHRGAASFAVSKTGAVSGKITYVEAPKLSGAPGPSLRAYTPVSRSLSSRFVASAEDPSKLRCYSRLGVGGQAGRQDVTLTLDLSASPPRFSATLRDFVSAVGEASPEGLACTGVAESKNITSLGLAVLGGSSADLSDLAGRYSLCTSEDRPQFSSAVGETGMLVVVQVLPSGRVVWVSRSPGANGSGSSSLNGTTEERVKAVYWSSQNNTGGGTHSTRTFLSELRLEWQSSLSWRPQFWDEGRGEGVVECQTTYAGRVNGKAVYDGAKFLPSAAAGGVENWTGAFGICFKTSGGDCWSTPERNGFTSFLVRCGMTQGGSSTVQVHLAVTDPDYPNPLQWLVRISTNGAVKCSPLSSSPSQVPLSLRIDRNTGAWSGSYLDVTKRKRRTLSGCVTTSEIAPNLIGEGWTEAKTSAAPVSQVGTWRAEVLR